MYKSILAQKPIIVKSLTMIISWEIMAKLI